MKAIVLREFGGRDVLGLEDVPRPVPEAGDVLIRIHAAGVNPVDWKIREGLLQGRLPHEFPIIPGWDAAGVVEDVGSQATRFRPGDEVYAYCRKPVIQHGCYAEYIALDETSVALKPRAFGFAEAASIPLAALTAYQSLFDAGGVRAGTHILIHAGAGGVGGFAIQLAKQAGAHVITTASARNHDYVKKLGADMVIDYNDQDFRTAIRDAYPRGLDVVYDTVGGDVQVASADVLKKGGTMVSILAFQDEDALRAASIIPKYVFVAPNAEQLDLLARMIDRGALLTHLSSVLPLDEAAEAHRLIESGHTVGKIVLRIAT